MSELSVADDVALVDLLDRVIGEGVVIAGDIVLSIAGVDLVYLGLRAVLAPAHVAGPSAIGRPDALAEAGGEVP
ncbi:MAG TPA: gas vesicle protein [Nocardioides sp.]|nr:gas vesicle protein [Nocardioides sp.]